MRNRIFDFIALHADFPTSFVCFFFFFFINLITIPRNGEARTSGCSTLARLLLMTIHYGRLIKRIAVTTLGGTTPRADFIIEASGMPLGR